ncbi:barnase inhibitor [Azoarcus indigens]|uniref:RNAse (Barnase) inhibitor barstar n=1 Tax=Azoarcus indigens TaxID=29545 RepID=A0A4R6E7E0_9RHOO|nr:barstar family protein [Azoarcus indigens]NMG63872.1 barnase inhibitor [Azoarcus indigens]TDN53853.1 RNAse (barnase) inhibitor barstar [Azoarcus indigens]
MTDPILSAAHNGIHPEGDPLPPPAQCRAAGLSAFTVDLEGCVDKPGLLARLAGTLDFPDWFGHNWDALADCLGDLSWLAAEGYLIVLSRSRQLRSADPSSWETLLEILAEAAELWREHGTPFHVFLTAAEA